MTQLNQGQYYQSEETISYPHSATIPEKSPKPLTLSSRGEIHDASELFISQKFESEQYERI